jgi:hypothetical protein
MVLFILRTFAQEEEIQTIHLPIIFASITDLLDVRNPVFTPVESKQLSLDPNTMQRCKDLDAVCS